VAAENRWDEKFKEIEDKFRINTLKGPKHEIFESGFFTQIRPVRVYDLGNGEKKITFHKLEPLIEGFCYEYLIKRLLSMRLITQKISR
jgi:hypothetical protein